MIDRGSCNLGFSERIYVKNSKFVNNDNIQNHDI